MIQQIFGSDLHYFLSYGVKYLLTLFYFSFILVIAPTKAALQIAFTILQELIKMSKLKAVDPKSAKASKPKVLIFGKPGVGKTWTSLDFPNVYYIDTEGGADFSHYTDKLKKSGGAYFGIEQGSLSFDSVLEQVEALATEKHQYKTLVIDSISKIFSLEIAKEAERLGDKNAFGADKKPAVAYMRRLTSWLTRMDMNVILISHEKDLYGLDEKKQRNVIGVTFDAYDKLEYELHLCLNIFKQAGQHKARVTKSRLLGFKDTDVLEWSYNSFAERYGKNILEGEVKPIILATEQQLKELQELFALVKLPEGYEESCLKRGQAETWAEMDSDKVALVIADIKKRSQTTQPTEKK